MADAVLGLLLENLSSLIHTEFGLLRGVKDEVEKLSSTLSTVRAVIEDAETREHTDKAIAGWLRRLKDAAYDAEDVLDEWKTELLRSELESTQVTHSIASWFHFNQPAFRRKIGKKIEKVHADFDSIAREISKFDLKTRVVERGALLDPSRETSSLLVEPEQIYGRNEDQKKIVDLLISDACSPYDVNVLPIVGVGGLGKTTFAQFIYNDERVSKHFEARMWVCVADDFDVKKLTTSIIASLSGKTCDLKDLDPLQNHLKELLSGRRFLLVLDDVWNNNPDTWGILKQSLTCGAKGSYILITTRLETVASMMSTLPLYCLPLLSDGECWSLFKVRACGIDNEDLSADLVKIGEQIVQKCRGIPLAAKVLGASLRFKRDVYEWELIRDSEIWELPEEKAILGALRLSYNHLPSEFRQCFSFCSLYPKDYILSKKELIQLWMANGYVPCIGRMELEDVGNNIFNELLRGSFFQDPGKDYFGNITCKMHDLMHDLACSITKTEICVVEAEKIDIVPKNVRHLSLIVNYWSQASSIPYKSLHKLEKSSVRTLSMAALSSNPQILQMIFSKLKHIRVLNLSWNGIKQIPNSIGGIKCLRYLNLCSNFELRVLPDSICSLINLQTLDLRYCSNLEALPKDMRKMRSLRHLDVGRSVRLIKMSIKMGEMTGLRTLSMFVVGEEKGEQINELNGLKHLSGELELRRLECVKDSTEAKEADLASKPNLSSLKLSWRTFYTGEKMMKNKKKSERVFQCFKPHVKSKQDWKIYWQEKDREEERVLECLKPHVNLNQKLIIEGYRGVVLPSWMSLLQKLKKIELSFCGKCQSLPPLGQLPLLQVLHISSMHSLKYIGVEFCGEIGGHHLKVFPSLEDLKLEWMDNLEKWEFPSSLLNHDASFPCLRSLSLIGCPKLETPSILMGLRKLNSLEIGGVSFSTQSIPNHTALQTLKFRNKDSILSGEFENLTALKSLEFVSCGKLKSIPDEIRNLTKLKSLAISGCDELISLPAEGLQELTSLNLNSFEIRGCASLKTLPAMGRMIQEGMMMKSSCCSLVFLTIQVCSSLTSVSEGLRYLSSLQTLLIYGCHELELKNEDFQHLTCLRHLILYCLPKLESVPDVQNLTALRSLQFKNLANLRMLPEGLQHLTSLQSLFVENCHPDLHKRIKRDKGVDWPNISHIPRVKEAFLQI